MAKRTKVATQSVIAAWRIKHDGKNYQPGERLTGLAKSIIDRFLKAGSAVRESVAEAVDDDNGGEGKGEGG